ncbi:SRPBCC family protein [Pseudonocardia sp. C8]|uniref:SRPBCC family protein n=1 Tax=Pseudonocardia sp. C8 TaxID=2762759 RepID=UPI0016432B9B|nr:SRPBCC family protein [Pseudonocardia sp. C8]MBC3192288.1 SRPBCC family protein [Pseudonocardia sp. C8]
MTDETMVVTRTVATTPEHVFAVLADPTRHAEVDGTGWVGDALDARRLTASGQTFRVAMYHPDHPDGNYEIENLVEVCDPPRTISWKPGYDDGTGTIRYGGWTWRYDLAPIGDGATAVTLTYDWSGVPASVREYLRFPPFGREHLENSLAHLDALSRP